MPAQVALGVSGDQFAAGALDAGADVWFSVVGGLFPEVALADRRATAASEHLEPLWALFRRHGGIRVVATAAALLGLAGEDNLPRPLRLLEGDARAEVEAVLRDPGSGPLDLVGDVADAVADGELHASTAELGADELPAHAHRGAGGGAHADERPVRARA